MVMMMNFIIHFFVIAIIIITFFIIFSEISLLGLLTYGFSLFFFFGVTLVLGLSFRGFLFSFFSSFFGGVFFSEILFPVFSVLGFLFHILCLFLFSLVFLLCFPVFCFIFICLGKLYLLFFLLLVFFIQSFFFSSCGLLAVSIFGDSFWGFSFLWFSFTWVFFWGMFFSVYFLGGKGSCFDILFISPECVNKKKKAHYLQPHIFPYLPMVLFFTFFLGYRSKGSATSHILQGVSLSFKDRIDSTSSRQG